MVPYYVCYEITLSKYLVHNRSQMMLLVVVN